MFVVPWNMAWTRKNNISMGRKHVAFSGLGFQTRSRRPSLYGIYRIFVSQVVSLIMRLLIVFFFFFIFHLNKLLWLYNAYNLVVAPRASHVAAPRLDFWRIQVLGHLIPWRQRVGMKVKNYFYQYLILDKLIESNLLCWLFRTEYMHELKKMLISVVWKKH